MLCCASKLAFALGILLSSSIGCAGRRVPPSTPTCPAGTDFVGGKCVAHADKPCAAGSHSEEGKGCVADAPKPAELPLHWRGDWQSLSGYRFSFTIHLAEGGKGSISWTLRATPTGSSLAPRIGETGTELVTWTWEPKKHELHLVGTKVDDATLLATDEYKLVVADDNRTFAGHTKGSAGDWANVIEGTSEP